MHSRFGWQCLRYSRFGWHTFVWLLVGAGWPALPWLSGQVIGTRTVPATLADNRGSPAAIGAYGLVEPPAPLSGDQYEDVAQPGSWIGRPPPLPWLHPGSDDRGRYLGPGDPLQGTSWLNRPFHAGWMVGALWGDELIRGQAGQKAALLGGYRLGWDFDHYWGMEGRFLFANPDVTDVSDPEYAGPGRDRFWDADLLYYPWGDSRWRPYLSIGLGWGTFELRDAAGNGIDQVLLSVPLGAGLKYYWKNWMAVRLSFSDNWTIGNDPFDSMHNLSLTGDVEVHWGARRTSYFPYGE
jgi:hypothetical protein